MGAADVVPGVSGGTVALVLAIYHRLIEAIRIGSRALGHFLRLDVPSGVDHLRRVEWIFLLPLLTGITLAVLTLSSLIERLLADHPVSMAGLFLGLVAGSTAVAWQLLTRRDVRRVVVLLVSAVVTWLALGIREATTDHGSGGVEDPALWVFFGSGAIAICAMILPGISGSFLLVTLGMYGAVLGAVNDRDVLAVGAVLLGCISGLALFSQLLHWALSRHYDTVMAALIGLMAGSLRVLWPWPRGVDSTALEAPSGPVLLPLALVVVGLAVVLVGHEAAKRFDRRDESEELRELQLT
jgi:putative membrane protein